MRSFRLAFLAHIAVGIAAVIALYVSAPLQDWEAVLLWFFGLPWLAGFIVFFVWATRNSLLVWMLPAVTFAIGFFIFLAAEWAAWAT